MHGLLKTTLPPPPWIPTMIERCGERLCIGDASFTCVRRAGHLGEHKSKRLQERIAAAEWGNRIDHHMVTISWKRLGDEQEDEGR